MLLMGYVSEYDVFVFWDDASWTSAIARICKFSFPPYWEPWQMSGHSKREGLDMGETSSRLGNAFEECDQRRINISVKL